MKRLAVCFILIMATAQGADVTIDGTVSTSTARGMRSVVFTNSPVPTAVAGDSVTTTTTAVESLNGGTASSGETQQAQSQSFTATASYQCSNVRFRFKKFNTPTDNLVLTVRTGSQTGTVVATSNNFGGSTLTSSLAWVTFTFPSAFSIASGTKYWLVLTRDGVRDITNFYNTESNSSSLLANGGFAYRNNNAWDADSATKDLLFQMMADTITPRGYWFYIDSAGTFVYSKSTDGGATWGTAVTINSATTQVAYDVWFDQWTPGDSGNLIHTWYFDTTNDIVRWRSLDTSTDTLGTERAAFTGASAVAGRGAFCSGTKTRSGYLYCAFDIDAGAEKGLVRSTDNGTTWSANLDATFIVNSQDQCLLFPATGTGDNNDMVSFLSLAAGGMQKRAWDSSAGTKNSIALTRSQFINTTDLTGQMGMSAAVRNSDGAIVAVYMSERDTVTADMLVSIIPADLSSPETTKTNITTDIDDIFYPAVFIDQNTDAIYVAYQGKRDGSEVLGTTSKTYYTKSTDNGTTWSSGDTAYQEGAASANFQTWAPISGPRFYVGWRVGTTLIGNAVNSVDVTPAGTPSPTPTATATSTPGQNTGAFLQFFQP
jgi:hypothetical protein